MPRNWIVYLVGPPGVGKLTVAKALAGMAGCKVVDNHYWLNTIFGLIQQDGVTPLPKGIWPLANQVRSAVLETIAFHSPADWSFVFTHAAVADRANREDDLAVCRDLAEVARLRNANMLSVRLACGAEELARRVTSPARRELMKDGDAQAARANAALGPFDPGWPATLEIDTTDLSAEETAARIMQHMANDSPSVRKTDITNFP